MFEKRLYSLCAFLRSRKTTQKATAEANPNRVLARASENFILVPMTFIWVPLLPPTASCCGTTRFVTAGMWDVARALVQSETSMSLALVGWRLGCKLLDEWRQEAGGKAAA